MRRVWIALFIIVLGVPSLSFAFTFAADQFLACEMNPYAGFTCPRVFAYLMPVASLGTITVIPFAVITVIWAGFALAMRLIRRR